MVDSNTLDTNREIAILERVRGKNKHVIEYLESFPFSGVKECIITEFCAVYLFYLIILFFFIIIDGLNWNEIYILNIF